MSKHCSPLESTAEGHSPTTAAAARSSAKVPSRSRSDCHGGSHLLSRSSATPKHCGWAVPPATQLKVAAVATSFLLQNFSSVVRHRNTLVLRRFAVGQKRRALVDPFLPGDPALRSQRNRRAAPAAILPTARFSSASPPTLPPTRKANARESIGGVPRLRSNKTPCGRTTRTRVATTGKTPKIERGHSFGRWRNILSL